MKIFLVFLFLVFCTTVKSQKVTDKWNYSIDAGLLSNTSTDYVMPYLTLSRSFSFNSNWNIYIGGMMAGTKRSNSYIGRWKTQKNEYEATIDDWTASLYLRVGSTYTFPITRTWGAYMGYNAWINPFPLANIDIQKTDVTTNKTTQKTYSKWCFSEPGGTLEVGVYIGSKKKEGKWYIGIEYGYFDRYSQKKRISVDGKKMNTFFHDYKSRIVALSARIAL